jgi:hypothetical protein
MPRFHFIYERPLLSDGGRFSSCQSMYDGPRLIQRRAGD